MFSIDYKSRLPFYEQLVESVKSMVLSGLLFPADALTFKLNTLADRRHSGSHYWIDSAYPAS